MKRLAPAILGVILAGLSAGALVGRVAATNVGSNTASGGTPAHACDTTINSQCIADSGVHRVYLGALPAGSAMIAAMQTAIATYDAVADVLAVEWSTSDADVRAGEGNYGNTSWWAYGNCSSAATYGGVDPHRWCYPQIIHFNRTHPSNWDGSGTGRNTVACHELGHTLGLRHSVSTQSSCMRNAQTIYPSITDHDNAMLNGLY